MKRKFFWGAEDDDSPAACTAEEAIDDNLSARHSVSEDEEVTVFQFRPLRPEKHLIVEYLEATFYDWLADQYGENEGERDPLEETVSRFAQEVVERYEASKCELTGKKVTVRVGDWLAKNGWWIEGQDPEDPVHIIPAEKQRVP